MKVGAEENDDELSVVTSARTSLGGESLDSVQEESEAASIPPKPKKRCVRKLSPRAIVSPTSQQKVVKVVRPRTKDDPQTFEDRKFFAEVVRDEFQKMISEDLSVDRPAVIDPPVLVASDMSTREVAVVCVSDLQIGKVSTSTISPYDMNVCRERMRKYAELVVKETHIRRGSVNIDRVHIWLLGDLVEGEDIFPGQQWTIERGLWKQVLVAADIVVNFVTSMLGEFQYVHVCGVVGNHGRIGKRGQFSPDTNSDRMVLDVVQMKLQQISVERLTFNFPKDGDRGWACVDEIGNYSSLLVHGDQFGGAKGGGFPLTGLKRAYAGWHACGSMEMYGCQFDMLPFKDIAFGHYHHSNYSTLNNGCVARCAGSVESSNAFAMERCAAQTRPSQYMFFVCPIAGVATCEMPAMYLDTVQSDKNEIADVGDTCGTTKQVARAVARRRTSKDEGSLSSAGAGGVRLSVVAGTYCTRTVRPSPSENQPPPTAKGSHAKSTL